VVGVIGDIVARISQLDGENIAIAAAFEEQSATTAEIASSLRNAAKAVDGLEGSIGRVSGMAEHAGKAMGGITHASRTLADEAVQLREATQALIKRLQAARPLHRASLAGGGSPGPPPFLWQTGGSGVSWFDGVFFPRGRAIDAVFCGWNRPRRAAFSLDESLQ